MTNFKNIIKSEKHIKYNILLKFNYNFIYKATDLTTKLSIPYVHHVLHIFRILIGFKKIVTNSANSIKNIYFANIICYKFVIKFRLSHSSALELIKYV